MKRLIITSLLLCGICMTMVAQGTSVLEQLCVKMAGSAASLNYEYTLTASDVKTLGAGVLTAQQKMYLMQGNGLKIYCNGSTIWVVDQEGKEIMIDNVARGTDAYLSNPALLLADISNVFSVGAPIKNGATLTYKLTPKSECGILSGTVVLNTSGAAPVFSSGSFNMSDGGQLDIKIKSMTFSEKKPLTFYTLDLSGFDSSWIITDLR